MSDKFLINLMDDTIKSTHIFKTCLELKSTVSVQPYKQTDMTGFFYHVIVVFVSFYENYS